MRNYYDNGELPAEGTICETDEHPFPNPDEDSTIMFAGKSDEDIELLEAVIGIRSTLYELFGTRRSI